MRQVDLLLLGEKAPPFSWPLGEVYLASRHPTEHAARTVEHLAASKAEHVLFWDLSLGQPDVKVIEGLMERCGDIWHAGLALGMQGLPCILDFVFPTWMLNRDADAGIESTSWRASLRACLVKRSILTKLGFLAPGFSSLEGAALEWGYRCIQRGAVMRNYPGLIANQAHKPPVQIPFEDEVRFARLHFGRRWVLWALARSLLTRQTSLWVVRDAWMKTADAQPLPVSPAYHDLQQGKQFQPPPRATVSVILPTLDRYPYLRTLLGQLRAQTVPPLEIIIIDQTEPALRPLNFYTEFKDLHLRIIFQEQPGQCSSRNAGIEASRGDHILFLDDDDEIPPNLIESHLLNLDRFQADVSSGIADVPGDTLPKAFRLIRISDVFPTNNTMVRRRALQRAGLFDLAYERNTVEDADLGMRIFLAGNRMILNPFIRVLHHHAPRGGLRAHKARVVTYASSRRSLGQRNLPSVTEVYLMLRYFSPRQVREGHWISVLGTFSLHEGSAFRKLLKMLISGVLIPHTLWTLSRRHRQAQEMLRKYPQIPKLRTHPALKQEEAGLTGAAISS